MRRSRVARGLFGILMLAPVCHVNPPGLALWLGLAECVHRLWVVVRASSTGDYRTDRGLCLLSMQEPVQKRANTPQKGGIRATSFGAVYRRSPGGGYALGEPSASAAAGSSSPAVSGLEGSFSVAEASSGVTFSGWWQAARWPFA